MLDTSECSVKSSTLLNISALKEAKREILRDMHVKELIQSNHSER